MSNMVAPEPTLGGCEGALLGSAEHSRSGAGVTVVCPFGLIKGVPCEQHGPHRDNFGGGE